MDFLEKLNAAQREAVVNLDGPMMVIAGAGSGKTRVLTYRLAFILSQGLADPQELLALTFTNKAAREMKERIFHLIGSDAKSIQMGTFHSIFSRILRVEAERIGYTSSYTIYDSDDSLKMIKTLLKEKNLDDKIYKPKVVASGISGAKNRLLDHSQLRETAIDDFSLKVAEIYRLYEERLFKSNAMDFDDLIIKPIKLFKGHPDILLKYQHRYQYLMVDEYQDTNHAQYILTKMLAAVHENICVVGDDAQSIYAFRGADIQNILNFKQDYPSVKVFKLEQNYRSTQHIVNAANSIISKNKNQIPKKVFTENHLGEPINLIEAQTEQDEARRVSDLIREQKQMLSYYNKDIAVLYRTNAQSRAVEDSLRRANLHYRVFGGLSFYQRKEIKDVVAYMRLAVNPRDEQAMMRVINYPTRGIGKTSLEKIIVFADSINGSMWDALDQIDISGLNRRVVNQIKAFTTMIKSFGVVARDKDAFEAANFITKQSGILKELHSENTVEGLGRWENVQELLNAAQEFTEDPDLDDHSLESFLADISLFTDQDKNDENQDVITLMTVHSAKGLEFKSVFLVGMEENLFPSSLSTETRLDLEEERRLFYVAVTRAKERLALSLARSRYRFGSLQFNEPSRFIDDIDPRFLRKPMQSVKRDIVRGPSERKSVVNRRTATSRPTAGNRSVVNSNFKAADPEDIVTGLQVLHQKFGKGKVVSVEGEGANKKATVFFKEKGQRVLLLKYAKLQIV